MSRTLEWHRAGLCACALFAAFLIKSHYSHASAEDLRWILAPTTVLVEWMSGGSFEFESGSGYISKAHYFLIAPSCSGVNFLMTAFVMLSLKWIWTSPTKRFQILSLPVAAGIAFIATLVANSVRISLALAFQSLNSATFHRMEGILIYFSFLLLLFVLTERGFRIKRFFFPLLIYYACALGIPVLNGAWKQGLRFQEHALFVMIIPLLLITILQLASLPGKYAQTSRA
ncbi:exosortase K [bacterium]|nr:exosortase K [bacterium]MCI0605836.1 exosortase K [bacterium]